jgi:hypothetical protein
MSPVVCVPDVNLVELGVRLPTGLVGMVVMQPFLKLTGEPFRCEPRHKAEQLAALERILTIAKAVDHGAEKTHFTVIPEYSIPGLDGIARIESLLRDHSWPNGTIVIGGTDALSKADYAALCDENGTSVDVPNMPCKVRNDEWINCCITWVKVADDDLRRWLQPKIAPSWLEQNVVHAPMFRGGSVFVFRCAFQNGLACRFFSLVCYDWVGVQGAQTIPRQVLAAINAKAEEVSLSWVFVPQHNEKPCNSDFLGGVASFFQDQADCQFVRRDRCCVITANTAGSKVPGKAATHGCSSLIFSPLSPFDFKGCHPTYSGKPALQRGSDALGQCGDVLFRERGACIHSFSQYVPGTVNLGAGGRSLPLQRAHVHPVRAELNDPRTPGAPVPACVKWVNDSLDEVPCLSQQIPGVPLAGSISLPHAANVTALGTVESRHLEKDIDWATWRPPKRDRSDEDKPPTADEWSDDQTAALEHVVHTLDILRMGSSHLDLARASGHAMANLRGQSVEVLAVRGPSHEECEGHARLRFIPPPRRQVLLVTRDPHNAPRLKRDRRIVETNSEPRLGVEPTITDVWASLKHVAFQDLMHFYIEAPSAVVLEDSIYGWLTT